MRKALIVVIAGTVFALAWNAQAEAFSLGGYSGPVQIRVSDYTDSARYPSAMNCADAGACDAAILTPPSNGKFGEDSWMIFQVTAIIRADTHASLWVTSSTEQLTGVVYGIRHHHVSINANGIGNIQSIGIPDPDDAGPLKGGIHLEMYLDSGAGITPFDPTGGPAARTGQNGYPTATDGVLFLSAALVPGATVLDTATLMDEDFDQAGPLTGFGVAFADVTGGSYVGMFDSNGLVTNLATLADLGLSFDFMAAAATSGWTSLSQDPISANVPEPSISMVLLALWLFGLAGSAFRRRVFPTGFAPGVEEAYSFARV